MATDFRRATVPGLYLRGLLAVPVEEVMVLRAGTVDELRDSHVWLYRG